jgi:hypothetical protein
MVSAMVVLMRVTLHVMTAGHYEDPAVHAHHVDVGAIQA